MMMTRSISGTAGHKIALNNGVAIFLTILGITLAATPMDAQGATPNVGYTATAPIKPPVGKGHTYYVSSPIVAAVDRANRALLPANATVYSTIQDAANVTQPGDTVLIMNGTYEPANPNLWVNAELTVYTSGTAAGYITYAAYPGAHPVLTTANSANTWDVIQVEASYIVIKGLEVIGSSQDETLQSATAAATPELALLKQEAAAGKPATYPSSAAKDIMNGNCIAGQNVTHLIILNNLVHNCSAAGIGIDVSDYITIEANTVYNSAWWTLYDTSGISIGAVLNSDSSTAYKNFVLDNISYDNANTQPNVYDYYENALKPGSEPPYPTDGEGIIVDTNQNTNNGSPYLGRTLVAGNITYGNGGAGIEIWRSNHVDTINNTAWMNDTCPVSGSICGPASSTTIGAPSTIYGADFGQIYSTNGNDNNFYNNIMYAPVGKYVYTNWNNFGTAENNNLMYSVNGVIYTDNYKLAAKDIAANPLWLVGAPVTDNFLLGAKSPGLYTGVNYINDNVSVSSLLGLTVQNGAVNIGADQ